MAQRRAPVRHVPFAELVERTGADVTALPPDLTILGWSAREGWLADTALKPYEHQRIADIGAFITSLGGPLVSTSWWSLLCPTDGWREHEPVASGTWAEADWGPGQPLVPGVVPRISHDRPTILCFGHRVGDPSTVLLPEVHYLMSRGYLKYRLERLTVRAPYARRRAAAVYAGGANGDATSFADVPVDGETPRQRLVRIAATARSPITAQLGGSVSRREQMRYRLILDVDGFARTWDAWAWKVRSGSTVLSQTSTWRAWFADEFTAGEHFVPVANDLHDVDDVVEWCLVHEDECRRIAERARSRADEVYAAGHVRQRLRTVLEGTVLG